MKWEEQVQKLDLESLRRSIVFLHDRYKLGEGGHSVEGLVVDAIFKAWEKYGQYRPELGTFDTWIRNWANSVCSQYYQQMKKRNTLSLDADERYKLIPRPGPGPLEWIVRQEDLAEAEVLVEKMEIAILVVKDSMRAMKTDLRVFRTYRELLTQDDGPVTKLRVAQVAGLSRPTVAVSLRRIADKCKKAGLLKASYFTHS